MFIHFFLTDLRHRSRSSQKIYRNYQKKKLNGIKVILRQKKNRFLSGHTVLIMNLSRVHTHRAQKTWKISWFIDRARWALFVTNTMRIHNFPSLLSIWSSLITISAVIFFSFLYDIIRFNSKWPPENCMLSWRLK